MAGLLYYLPGQHNCPNRDRLEGLGLAYAFDGPGLPDSIGVTHGPIDEPGIVLADPGSLNGQRVGYFEDTQTWRKLPAELSPDLAVHVGYYTAARPTPAELARPEQLPGHAVTLGDGQVWEIPVARGVAEVPAGDQVAGVPEIRLPQRIDLDDAGRWVLGDVEAAYAALWADACRYWDAKTAAIQSADVTIDDPTPQTVELNLADVLDIAARALGCNYRVGKLEAVFLGLLTEATTRHVCDALIDWASWLALLKKNQTSATSSAPT